MLNLLFSYKFYLSVVVLQLAIVCNICSREEIVLAIFPPRLLIAWAAGEFACSGMHFLSVIT